MYLKYAAVSIVIIYTGVTDCLFVVFKSISRTSTFAHTIYLKGVFFFFAHKPSILPAIILSIPFDLRLTEKLP